ncbi:MAG: hypothetical protein IPP52_16280 [Ignavibacteria bacterium]|nr:hypothetical protein [Ignavibacteria bacterium]
MELISPENKEQILFLLPSFTWLPPTPVPPGKLISYQFQITEILNRQTPEYAFLANPIYFHSEKLLTTLFSFRLQQVAYQRKKLCMESDNLH